MNFKFYVIIDGKNGGICSLKHDEYASLKAVFNDIDDAEKAIAKNGSPDLFVQPVFITEGVE